MPQQPVCVDYQDPAHRSGWINWRSPASAPSAAAKVGVEQFVAYGARERPRQSLRLVFSAREPRHWSGGQPQQPAHTRSWCPHPGHLSRDSRRYRPLCGRAGPEPPAALSNRRHAGRLGRHCGSSGRALMRLKSAGRELRWSVSGGRALVIDPVLARMRVCCQRTGGREGWRLLVCVKARCVSNHWYATPAQAIGQGQLQRPGCEPPVVQRTPARLLAALTALCCSSSLKCYPINLGSLSARRRHGHSTSGRSDLLQPCMPVSAGA